MDLLDVFRSCQSSICDLYDPNCWAALSLESIRVGIGWEDSKKALYYNARKDWWNSLQVHQNEKSEERDATNIVAVLVLVWCTAVLLLCSHRPWSNSPTELLCEWNALCSVACKGSCGKGQHKCLDLLGRLSSLGALLVQQLVLMYK